MQNCRYVSSSGVQAELKLISPQHSQLVFKVPSTPQLVGPERLLAALFGTFAKSVSAARWPQPSLTKTQNCRRRLPPSLHNKQQLKKTAQLIPLETGFHSFLVLLLLFASTGQLITFGFSFLVIYVLVSSV